MAYIKIFPIKVTVKKAISYITNPDKTDDQLLVSSFGCSPETADLEFAMTAEMGKNNVMDKGNNLAWHMVISFHPNELFSVPQFLTILPRTSSAVDNMDCIYQKFYLDFQNVPSDHFRYRCQHEMHLLLHRFPGRK